jgi:hypothetical protein
MSVIPATWEAEVRETEKHDTISKNKPKAKSSGGMAPVEACLLKRNVMLHITECA